MYTYAISFQPTRTGQYLAARTDWTRWSSCFAAVPRMQTRSDPRGDSPTGSRNRPWWPRSQAVYSNARETVRDTRTHTFGRRKPKIKGRKKIEAAETELKLDALLLAMPKIQFPAFLSLFCQDTSLTMTSMHVNLATHGQELAEAYRAVLSDSEPTNWLIFSYDKGTSDLKVQGTGGNVSCYAS